MKDNNKEQVKYIKRKITIPAHWKWNGLFRKWIPKHIRIVNVPIDRKYKRYGDFKLK